MARREPQPDVVAEIAPYIKVRLPKTRQSYSYDCGAAALWAVCSYFGVATRKKNFLKLCGTTEDGTRPPDLVRVARLCGLSAKCKSGMTIPEVEYELDLGRPVLCCLQAYGDEAVYEAVDAGHYVVAIGYGGGSLYFEDPAMRFHRAFLPYAEFERRWKDRDVYGRPYNQFGITIWSREDSGPKSLRRAKKLP